MKEKQSKDIVTIKMTMTLKREKDLIVIVFVREKKGKREKKCEINHFDKNHYLTKQNVEGRKKKA
jgi:hypothetical protein